MNTLGIALFDLKKIQGAKKKVLQKFSVIEVAFLRREKVMVNSVCNIHYFLV